MVPLYSFWDFDIAQSVAFVRFCSSFLFLYLDLVLSSRVFSFHASHSQTTFFHSRCGTLLESAAVASVVSPPPPPPPPVSSLSFSLGAMRQLGMGSNRQFLLVVALVLKWEVGLASAYFIISICMRLYNVYMYATLFTLWLVLAGFLVVSWCAMKVFWCAMNSL